MMIALSQSRNFETFTYIRLSTENRRNSIFFQFSESQISGLHKITCQEMVGTNRGILFWHPTDSIYSSYPLSD